MIQKKICDYESISNLLMYEKTMMKKCQKLTDHYAILFKPYGCELKLEYFWLNFFRDDISLIREPLINGYTFYASIAVVRNGKVVRYRDIEEDFDYYEISFSWPIDAITRKGVKLKIDYLSDVLNDMEDDLRGFEALLDHITKSHLEISY